MNTKNANALLLQNEDKRTKCMVYTRVMGYHRPVESFNIGKKGEHKQRVFFSKVSSGKADL
ncbi:MAG: anaerobic ribonucleoside-triphosphate reductase [Niabella sp.]|jgi:anaerobic ribonucleoside-triphosphate reductase